MGGPVNKTPCRCIGLDERGCSFDHLRWKEVGVDSTEVFNLRWGTDSQVNNQLFSECGPTSPCWQWWRTRRGRWRSTPPSSSPSWRPPPPRSRRWGLAGSSRCPCYFPAAARFLFVFCFRFVIPGAVRRSHTQLPWCPKGRLGVARTWPKCPIIQFVPRVKSQRAGIAQARPFGKSC